MGSDSILGYTIGIFAKKLKITRTNLRNYEKMGILVPKRNDTNRRIYTNKEYIKAEFILFLTRNLGLNIAGVKIVLAIFDNFNIEFKNRLLMIQKISETSGFNKSIQKKNLVKNKNKGRKPNFLK